MKSPIFFLAGVAAAVALAATLSGPQPGSAKSAASNLLVQVIDIDGTINAGMAHRVQRAVEEARTNGAAAILVSLKTNGGVVDDANDIRDALASAGIPTIAYVSERAWSAGALIALACDRIYMAPGSSIGAAEPIPTSAKTISAIRAEFVSLAEQHHRNPQIAAGMVDPSVVIAGLKDKGQILSLSPEQGRKYRFIDGIATSDEAALAAAGFPNPRLSVSQPTLGERIAQFITEPVVSGLLLSIGLLALLIEFQTGHLISGIVGVLALALFFGGHIIAGASTWLIVTLFVLGLVGLLFELHVLPGHGISGTIGAVLVLASIIVALGGFSLQSIFTLFIALLVAIIVFAVLLRYLPESAFGRRLAFAGAQSVAEGYVTAAAHSELVGHDGIAESLLRPVGVAKIDGVRYQVQSVGDFIPPQTRIRVLRVEGATIFVTRA